MASTSTTAPAPGSSARRARPRLIADTMTMTWRNLITYKRVPELLVFSTIQPVIFVVMFRYVFGGAIQRSIQDPNVRYVDFLMPGVFVQTVVFGAMATGIGLAEDFQKGLIERFRSLPMARAAVLAGRALADLVRNVFVVILMCIVGAIVGFRLHAGILPFIGGMGLLLLFAFAFSWVMALLGLGAPNAESAQAIAFPILALLVFPSASFVPVTSMPGWLQAYAKNQPVSVTAEAIRHTVLGGPTAGKVLASIAWSLGIILVFAPLAVRRYVRQ